MKQILEGVHYIHTHNIIYLDLKVRLHLHEANLRGSSLHPHPQNHPPGPQGKMVMVCETRSVGYLCLSMETGQIEGVNVFYEKRDIFGWKSWQILRLKVLCGGDFLW